MTTPFPEWLKSLGLRRADLTAPFAAVRGLLVEHTVNYPGDLTTAALTMTVKASPDSPDELATFTIGTPVFADGVTSWVVSLPEGWSIAADTDGDGVEMFIYDALLTPLGGSAVRIFGGLFEVSGYVTEPA